MAKKCEICGKGPVVGRQHSHANNVSARRFEPNLQLVRAMAISGVALSVDQIPQDFSNSEQTGLIDSDGSIIIHGIQAGVECRY